jgi:hypothetical protein
MPQLPEHWGKRKWSSDRVARRSSSPVPPRGSEKGLRGRSSRDAHLSRRHADTRLGRHRQCHRAGRRRNIGPIDMPVLGRETEQPARGPALLGRRGGGSAPFTVFSIFSDSYILARRRRGGARRIGSGPLKSPRRDRIFAGPRKLCAMRQSFRQNGRYPSERRPNG